MGTKTNKGQEIPSTGIIIAPQLSSKLGKVDTSIKRPKMIFFRKVDEIKHVKFQRVKNFSLRKIARNDLKSETTVKIIDLIRVQKSSWKGVKVIHLYIPDLVTNLGIKGIEDLPTAVRNNPKRLQKLHMTFPPFAKVTDQAIYMFAIQVGKNLPQLDLLDLNFTYCLKLTDLAVLSLAKWIKMNKRLQQLKLNFSFCNALTDSGFLALGTVIGAHLKQLSCLDINLHGCTMISDQGVTAIVLQIEKLPQLKNLYLRFCGSENITDYGVSILAHQIGKRLHQLRTVSLFFRACQNVTNEGLSAIGSQIGNHINGLNLLSLSFPFCKQINDEGMISLKTAILPVREKIKCLVLDFSRSSVSDQGELILKTFEK